MEADRSGDVVHWVLEDEPERPRPPRRRRRWAAAALASIVAVSGLTAGASALAGSGDDRARPAKTRAAKPRPKVFYTADGVPTRRSGHECRAGEGRKTGRSAKRRIRSSYKPY
jgi:hypothetical protein